MSFVCFFNNVAKTICLVIHFLWKHHASVNGNSINWGVSHYLLIFTFLCNEKYWGTVLKKQYVILLKHTRTNMYVSEASCRKYVHCSLYKGYGLDSEFHIAASQYNTQQPAFPRISWYVKGNGSMLVTSQAPARTPIVPACPECEPLTELKALYFTGTLLAIRCCMFPVRDYILVFTTPLIED